MAPLLLCVVSCLADMQPLQMTYYQLRSVIPYYESACFNALGVI